MSAAGQSRDRAMREALQRVSAGEGLSAEQAASVFREIMAGDCTPAQIGGLLIGLAQRGEGMAEIEGAARAMREASIVVPTSRARVIDTCGTGGSGIPRRNVSTAVAIVAAACGVAVAKHGNRAASSRSGSADVLEALGVDIQASPERVGHCIDELGVGFLFARALHPAMKHAGPVRAQLGVRTLFNLLGPLCNPARVRRQVMGCFDPRRLGDLAAALGALGAERAFVVHGYLAGVEPTPTAKPGLDDLSPDGISVLMQWRAGRVTEHRIRPEDAGLEPSPLAEIAGGDPKSNAQALRELLAGAPGGYRQSVQYAGALALLVASDEDLDALPKFAARIGQALDDGSAAGVLARLVDYSHGRHAGS